MCEFNDFSPIPSDGLADFVHATVRAGIAFETDQFRLNDSGDFQLLNRNCNSCDRFDSVYRKAGRLDIDDNCFLLYINM